MAHKNKTIPTEVSAVDFLDSIENERRRADGHEGRLVSMYTFTGPRETWEVHPNGAEVVICVAGAMTLHQENADGSTTRIELTAGQYAINPPGVRPR